MLVVTFVIQGLYAGEWKDWNRYPPTVGEPEVRHCLALFERGLNPKATERTVPSAARLVRRTTTDEVLP